MNFRLRLSSILVFALSSIVMPRAQEYVVGPAAFDIGQAQQNCQSIGRDLAGFDERNVSMTLRHGHRLFSAQP